MFHNGIIKARIFSVLTIMLMVIGIPFTINILKQQQITQQNAQVYDNTNSAISSTHPAESDSCNLVSLTFKESAVCPRVGASGHNTITNYTFTIQIKSKDGKAHKVTYYKESDFCVAGSIPTSSNTCKENNRQSNGNVLDVPENKDTKSITIDSTKPASYQTQSCGTYQQDFAITSIDGKSNCIYQRPKPAGTLEVGSVGFCETGTTCKASVCPIPAQKEGIKLSFPTTCGSIQ